MQQTMMLNIRGIKCDACHYKQMDVQPEDYPEWVNKPCPDCGENLLTESDYESVQSILAFTEMVNKIFPVEQTDTSGVIVKGELEMNGTGEMKVKSVAFEEK